MFRYVYLYSNELFLQQKGEVFLTNGKDEEAHNDDSQ